MEVMTSWATSTLMVLLLALGGALHIRLRWRRVGVAVSHPDWRFRSVN